jgi:hypothetical protein
MRTSRERTEPVRALVTRKVKREWDLAAVVVWCAFADLKTNGPLCYGSRKRKGIVHEAMQARYFDRKHTMRGLIY